MNWGQALAGIEAEDGEVGEQRTTTSRLLELQFVDHSDDPEVQT